MGRTPEEFCQQLPHGQWVVADYEGSRVQGKLACITRMLRMVDLTPHEALHSRHVVKYTTKRSCKRAAERMIARIDADDLPPLSEQYVESQEMKGGK
jgi:hypothetical protein